MEEDISRFGQNVRAARVARGWTQEELAERAGLSPVQISRVERGRREIRLGTLVVLVESLGVSADELLRGVTRRAGKATAPSEPKDNLKD